MRAFSRCGCELRSTFNVTVHPVGLGREAARLPFDDRELSFSSAATNKARASTELEIVPGDAALKKAPIPEKKKARLH
jgi:hypothetical protein